MVISLESGIWFSALPTDDHRHRGCLSFVILSNQVKATMRATSASHRVLDAKRIDIAPNSIYDTVELVARVAATATRRMT